MKRTINTTTALAVPELLSTIAALKTATRYVGTPSLLSPEEANVLKRMHEVFYIAKGMQVAPVSVDSRTRDLTNFAQQLSVVLKTTLDGKFRVIHMDSPVRGGDVTITVRCDSSLEDMELTYKADGTWETPFGNLPDDATEI